MLITGSIWAKASWGHWWVWDEPTLVSFLIVFLLYATYYPFRYAIEDRERQARYASVFAITAGAFVPLNFIAVRLAESLVHPRIFATAEGGLPGEMLLTFLVCLAGDRAALGDAGQVRADREERLRPAHAAAPRARRAEPARRRLADRPGGELMRALPLAAPALPLDEAGKYVAGAYIVFVVLLARLRRDHGREAAADRARAARAGRASPSSARRRERGRARR